VLDVMAMTSQDIDRHPEDIAPFISHTHLLRPAHCTLDTAMRVCARRQWIIACLLLLLCCCTAAGEDVVAVDEGEAVAAEMVHEDMADEATSTTPTTNAAKDAAATTKTTATDAQQLVKDLEVVSLNSRNLGRHLSDGNVWLIEFYAPSCIHCVEFEAIYADIAKQYHANRALKIKVGKINAQVEHALVSRFNVRGFPSFFVVDGWTVYEFSQARTKKNLMSYAEGGYKTTDSIPFYTSPMGPLGLMQAGLMFSGHTFVDVFVWTQNTLGLSSILVGSLLFGAMFLGLFFVIVFLALVIPPKHKRD
jgi:thiol-disulfide isomerase/thioredoxin